MAQTRMRMPLSMNPNTQSYELWNRMAGRYRMVRRGHHNQITDGEVFNTRDIESLSRGISDITARPPTVPGYSRELLQSSTLLIITKSGKTANILEKRVFRLQDGQWSVWNMQDIEGDVVGSKLTDLEFRLVRPLVDPAFSQEVTVGACKIP